MRTILLLFIVCIGINSCIVKKRLHMPGYYVQWIREGKGKIAQKNQTQIKDSNSFHQTIQVDSSTNIVEKIELEKLSVYDEINKFRAEIGLSSLLCDTSLELASAQHGCWLALYNFRLNPPEIILQSNETELYLAKKLNDPLDRIRTYTNREIYFIQESLNYYYQKPTIEEITNFMKNKVLSVKSKFFGFWVIKYETKSHRPIWYLVFLITD